MNATYRLFLRNWENGRASEEQIQLAVAKDLLTEDEAVVILATEQSPV